LEPTAMLTMWLPTKPRYIKKNFEIKLIWSFWKIINAPIIQK
jgi:hypothetical protein